MDPILSQKKSTYSKLLDYYSFVNESFTNRAKVDSICAAFAKLFDRVDHNILILKLHKLSLDWSVDLISNRLCLQSVESYIRGTTEFLLWPNFIIIFYKSLKPLVILRFLLSKENTMWKCTFDSTTLRGTFVLSAKFEEN